MKILSNHQASLVWQACLSIIQKYIAADAFKTWFEPIRAQQLDKHSNTLTIELPNYYFYEWIEEYYLDVLRIALKETLGEQAKLDYAVVVDQNQKDGKMVLGTSKTQTHKPEPSSNPAEALKKEIEERNQNNSFDSGLSYHFTFDNFIEGSCNKFARGAGLTIAQNPGLRSFNPFLIFGGVGVGKTHLAHAIGNEIKERNPKAKVFQINCESFISEFVEAVRQETEHKNGAVKNFTDFYMLLDVLIIDDVQFMAKKDKTQENFFNIFNHLHLHNKQIIMTCDRPPKDIEGLKDRLISRIKYGVQAEIQTPDAEFRKNWLIRKCKTEGLAMSEEMINYIAKENFACVRELEGVVLSMLAQHSIMKKALTIELAQEVMKHQIATQEREVSLQGILSKVSKYFHITIEDMQSKTKTKDVAEARQVAMYFAKNYANLPVKAIAAELGKRDHSTVVHASKNIAEKMKTQPALRKAIEEIASQLRIEIN